MLQSYAPPPMSVGVHLATARRRDARCMVVRRDGDAARRFPKIRPARRRARLPNFSPSRSRKFDRVSYAPSIEKPAPGSWRARARRPLAAAILESGSTRSPQSYPIQPGSIRPSARNPRCTPRDSGPRGPNVQGAAQRAHGYRLTRRPREQGASQSVPVVQVRVGVGDRRASRLPRFREMPPRPRVEAVGRRARRVAKGEAPRDLADSVPAKQPDKAVDNLRLTRGSSRRSRLCLLPHRRSARCRCRGCRRRRGRTAMPGYRLRPGRSPRSRWSHSRRRNSARSVRLSPAAARICFSSSVRGPADRAVHSSSCSAMRLRRRHRIRPYQLWPPASPTHLRRGYALRRYGCELIW